MRIEETIPSIIDGLYAGALEDAPWSRAMIRIADLVGASGADLFSVDLINGRVLRDESHRIDPAVAVAYREGYSSKDILVAPTLRVPVGEPTEDHKLVPIDIWRKSEIYNELALPNDLPHVLVTLLHKTPGQIVALSLKGSQGHGLYSDDEARRVKIIVPHIHRALQIKDRLALAQVNTANITNSLDNLSFGVIVLDASGRMIEASTVAADMMRAPDSGITHGPDKRLRLPEPAGTDLYRWVIAGKPPANPGGLLHIARSSKAPISMLVSALPENTRSWIAGGPRWILLLFDPERRTQVSILLIAHDLGISEREAEICALLVAGHDLKGIAARLNISIHTARTHLKTVFGKTGIRSQAELIQRIARGPAAIVRPG
jgi:DNA-binding CsgD family transcriptional regulator